MNVFHGHQNLTKGGSVKNVCSRRNVLSDIVRDFLVGVVDVYRQPQQEVGQTKNRPML